MEMSEQQKLRQELLAFRERMNDELQLIINRYCPQKQRAPRATEHAWITMPNGKTMDIGGKQNGNSKKSSTGR